MAVIEGIGLGFLEEHRVELKKETKGFAYCPSLSPNKN